MRGAQDTDRLRQARARTKHHETCGDQLGSRTVASDKLLRLVILCNCNYKVCFVFKTANIFLSTTELPQLLFSMALQKRVPARATSPSRGSCYKTGDVTAATAATKWRSWRASCYLRSTSHIWERLCIWLLIIRVYSSLLLIGLVATRCIKRTIRGGRRYFQMGESAYHMLEGITTHARQAILEHVSPSVFDIRKLQLACRNWMGKVCDWIPNFMCKQSIRSFWKM